MPNYRRAWIPGGTYFFTVNLLERGANDLLVRHVDLLRNSIKLVKQRHPFIIHGWVILPDHLHCVLELPEGDCDYAGRWRLIKSGFSKGLPRQKRRSSLRLKRRERGIWQRRYWEHAIRDDADLRAHMDQMHFNPVKHRLVNRVMDWPFSMFHMLVRNGIYPIDWSGSV